MFESWSCNKLMDLVNTLRHLGFNRTLVFVFNNLQLILADCTIRKCDDRNVLNVILLSCILVRNVPNTNNCYHSRFSNQSVSTLKSLFYLVMLSLLVVLLLFQENPRKSFLFILLTEKSIPFDYIFFPSIQGTVFKSLTDAVREGEIRKTGTDVYRGESKNS